MANIDLERFRQKLREYRLLVNRNQGDLATYLNLDYSELSNRLNAHKNAHLSHDNVRTLVRALTEWGAITTRAQAEELLDLMLCPHFDAVDLQARPLSRLVPLSVSARANPLPAASGSTLKNPPAKESVPLVNGTSPAKLPGRPEPAHNLPKQLSSFIGRHQEVAELKKLLTQEKAELLTLTGTGGCGKTRLALQVATELSGSFGEGLRQISDHQAISA